MSDAKRIARAIEDGRLRVELDVDGDRVFSQSVVRNPSSSPEHCIHLLMEIQDGVARAMREAWEAVEQNPSITKEGLLNLLAVKLSTALNVYPEYSEATFFNAIEVDPTK